MSSGDATAGLSAIGEADYHGERLLEAVAAVLPGWRVSCKQHAGRLGACRLLVGVLDRLPGARLQDRWEAFEERVWPAQHILGGLKALEERKQRGCWRQRRAWRFGGQCDRSRIA